MEEPTGHGLGPTRAAVLQHLLNSANPVGVAEIASELGLHANSARFHLDALTSAGYATRNTERLGSQGRPRVVYNATKDAPDVTSQHLRDLLGVFVKRFVEVLPDALDQAEQAGETWGRRAVHSPSDTPLEALVEHTAQLGFTTSLENDGRALRFERCPYRIAEGDELDPICAVHLGMMRGFLDENGSSVRVTDLRRGDTACLAQLATD